MTKHLRNLLLFSLLFGQATAFAESNSRLIAFEKTLPLHRLILLATESSENEGIPASEIAEGGFSGATEAIRVEPQLLLTVNSHGVSEVFGFQLSGEYKRETLPPKLMDLQGLLRKKMTFRDETRWHRFLKNRHNGLFGKFLSFWRGLSGQLERARRLEASRLVQLVEHAIENPELDLLLPKADLKELAAILRIRFENTTEMSGFFHSRELIEAYEETRLAILNDLSAKNFNRLVTEANQAGQTVRPITRDFAILELDEPLSLYSLTAGSDPVILIDFKDPSYRFTPKKKSFLRKFLGLPFSVLALPYKGLRAIVEAVRFPEMERVKLLDQKTGSAYLHLMADLDTHVVDEETLKLVRSALGEMNLFMVPKSAERWARLSVGLRDEKLLESLSKRLEKEDGKTRKQILKVEEEIRKHSERGPASEDSVGSEDSRPVILFMVDSLRPDKLREAVLKENSPAPLLKKLFFDGGHEVRSFNTNAISLPSWTTILSGFDPSATSLKSSYSGSRDLAVELFSYMDPRLDKQFGFIGARTSLGLRRLNDVGLDWIVNSLAPEEVVQHYMLLHDGHEIPYVDLLRQMGHIRLGMRLKTFNDGEIWDRANTVEIIRKIDRDKKKSRLRLVLHYSGSIDHDAHRSPFSLELGMRRLNANIGLVLNSAKDHPVLKNAVLILVSDHGMSGGIETPKTNNPFVMDRPFFLNNTEFNITKFFAGQYKGYEDLRFVVATGSPADPNQGKKDKKGLLPPNSYIYPRKKHKGQVTLVNVQSGNAYAPLYFPNHKSNASDRLSFAELSKYTGPGWKGDEPVDIPETLLNLVSPNVNAIQPHPINVGLSLNERLEGLNGLRPIGLFAMALQGEKVRSSVAALCASDCESTEDPILIRAHGARSALILSRAVGTDFRHRYIIVQNFSQDMDGTVHGELINDVSKDPLYMPGMQRFVRGHRETATWRSDREILAAVEGEWYPTAIPFFAQTFLLAPRLKEHANRAVFEGEVPDVVIVSSYGFDFNQNEDNEGDHGGLSLDQVRTTFMINDGTRSGETLEPAFTRDILPTIADYLGRPGIAKNPLGRSQRPRSVKLGKSWAELLKTP